MSGPAVLVMLVTALIVAATGAFLIIESVEEAGNAIAPPTERANLEIVNVIAQNITDNTMKHVRIQVEADAAVRLSDTLITLSTENASADLQYRNGTLERNTTTGFYTR